MSEKAWATKLAGEVLEKSYNREKGWYVWKVKDAMITALLAARDRGLEEAADAVGCYPLGTCGNCVSKNRTAILALKKGGAGE